MKNKNHVQDFIELKHTVFYLPYFVRWQWQSILIITGRQFKSEYEASLSSPGRKTLRNAIRNSIDMFEPDYLLMQLQSLVEVSFFSLTVSQSQQVASRFWDQHELTEFRQNERHYYLLILYGLSAQAVKAEVKKLPQTSLFCIKYFSINKHIYYNGSPRKMLMGPVG